MLTGTLEPTSGKLLVLGQVPAQIHPPGARADRLHAPALRPLRRADRVARTCRSSPRCSACCGRSAAGGSPRSSSWSICGKRAAGARGSCRAACSGAWSWPARWSTSRCLLFVDEPTAGLDPMLRQKVWAEFRRLREDGRTLVVTTQYVGEAEYCDMVAVLVARAIDRPGRAGRAAADGSRRRSDRNPDGHRPSTRRRSKRCRGVRSVRQNAPRHLLVITDDAGAATPRLLQEIQAAGRRGRLEQRVSPVIRRSFRGTGRASGASGRRPRGGQR